MSIREILFSKGTALRLKGNDYEGNLAVDLEGFSFDRGVGQNVIAERYPEDCNTLDLRYANIYKIYLTDDIADFSAVHGGIGTYIFMFVQDSVGGRAVVFDDDFYFPSSIGRPDLSTSNANDIDIVSFLYDGFKFYGNFMQDFINT